MTDYKAFFNQYRSAEVKEDKDFLYQVGWTQGKNPISGENFKTVVDLYIQSLNLNEGDLLIDLCCGNGVITYELSKKVKQVIAIDFSEPFIKTAQQMKAAENINYYNGNIIEFDKIINPVLLKEYKDKNIKFLMSFSLGYFKIKDFQMLLNTCSNFKNFSFYISGIPDYSKHTLIFNTSSKKMAFILNDRFLGKTQGIGRFWKIKEIEKIALQNKLTCLKDNNLNSVPGHNYRFNVLIQKTA